MTDDVVEELLVSLKEESGRWIPDASITIREEMDEVCDLLRALSIDENLFFSWNRGLSAYATLAKACLECLEGDKGGVRGSTVDWINTKLRELEGVVRVLEVDGDTKARIWEVLFDCKKRSFLQNHNTLVLFISAERSGSALEAILGHFA